jgi:hypothetical protein
MLADPALATKVGPHVFREREMGGVVTVQVADLPGGRL